MNTEHENLVKILAGDLIKKMHRGDLSESDLLFAKTKLNELEKEDMIMVGDIIQQSIDATQEGTKSNAALGALMAAYNEIFIEKGWDKNGEQEQEEKSPVMGFLNKPHVKTSMRFAGGGAVLGMLITLISGMKGWAAFGTIGGFTLAGGAAGFVYSAPSMETQQPFVLGSDAYRKCYNKFINAGYTPEEARGHCMAAIGGKKKMIIAG